MAVLAHYKTSLGLILLCLLLGCGKPPSSSGGTQAPAGSVITQNLVKRSGGPLWNIESVGLVSNAWTKNSFELPAQAKSTIIGWAVDQEAKAAAGGVEVVIDGVPYAAQYGKSRPDVAVSFGVRAYSNSGYSFDLAANQFTPGTHTMFVRVLTNDQKGYWEMGPYTIDLK